MARVKQFADDLGISKNQAQSLINKGRSRKDGGKDEEYMIDRELTLDELLSNKRNLDLDKKKDGGTLKMRGGGIAVQGLGFKGVR
jgi:hypothetical protein